MIVFGFAACAPVRKLETPPTANGLHDLVGAPRWVSLWDFGKYVVMSSEEGRGVLSLADKAGVTIIRSDMPERGYFSIDPRRAEIYFLGGGQVRIFSLKKKDAPARTIDLDPEGEYGDIRYSLMNRRAYAIDSKTNRLWEVDPEKNSAGVIDIQWVDVDSAKVSFRSLTPSVDGARIYVVGRPETGSEDSEGAVVGLIRLREKRGEILARVAGITDPGGMDLYQGEILVMDGKNGLIRGIDPRTGKQRELPHGFQSGGPWVGMVVEHHTALTLGAEESGHARLERVSLYGRGKK